MAENICISNISDNEQVASDISITLQRLGFS